MHPAQPDPAALSQSSTSVSDIARAELSTMDTAPFPVILSGGLGEPAPDVRVDIRAPLFPDWPDKDWPAKG